MFCAALCMPVAILALTTHNDILALILIGVACGGHQAWSANLFTLTSDTFPKHAVGSIVGLGQTGGAAAGSAFQLVIGRVVDTVGYTPLFIAAGCFHFLAFTLVCLLFRTIQPIVFSQKSEARAES